MSTRRLAFSDNLTRQELTWNSSQEIQEIEVPEGESHFHIFESGETEQHFIFHLRHPHSQVLVTGFVEARGESAPRLHTEVVHHIPNTKAETLIRTLAYDSSQPHYQGLITIEPSAQGAESYLNHHSLLLGKEARSWTLPSLEIKANEVKCSHAATLRSITDLDLFYLRSRGLSEEESTELLISAFIADVQ